MDFELQKPQMNQSQKLTMTYLMKRSFLILQMTNLELKEFLTLEIEKNPILDIKIKSDNYSYKKKENPSPFFIKHTPSLFEHLLRQAKEIFQDKKDLWIAENIIGNLDKKGYFTSDIDVFAKDLQVDNNKVLEILEIIKTFDPKAVAAKNLQERILLQIDNKNSVEYKIIKEHFQAVLKNKIEKIAKKIKIEAQIIQQLIEKTFKNINFDPTLNFLPKEPLDIHPDIIINKIGKKWIIEIEEDLPFFEINKSYINILENKKKRSSKKYLFGAKILMKNILIRRKTLQDICCYIIQKQASFILGKGLLNPLTIKEVASYLKLHTSTISRAILNKYIQCPLGLLPMKTFFSHSYKEKSNLKHFETVLKEILLEENKNKPLSDIELTNKLKQKGFLLHRRTICKYRKKLNIGTLRQRKKYFKNI